MAANYLHGVETTEVETGPVSVTLVKSAVIALIGIAPIGPQGLTLTLSDKDDAQFGPQLEGFTIRQALDGFRDFKAGAVFVVNVLNPAIHKTAHPEETVNLDAATGIGKTTKAGLVSATVKSADGAAPLVKDTDYTIELVTGTITRIPGGAIPAGNPSVKVTYEYADPTKVTPADIIGTVDAAGDRTGLQVLKDTFSLYGFFAKILTIPTYCTLNSVAVEMTAMANNLGAVAYVDAPIGTTFAQALQGRGPAGTINFNTSSDRVRLCYPHVTVYDPVTNADRLEPLSVRAAGLRALTDNEKGYWWSSSNQELLDITGVERQLSAMIDDPNCEVNLLNEKGITTVFNSYGSGYRLWGNRTAAFPTVTHMRNFENVRRTGDVINESIRYFAQQFSDRPTDQAFIDSIVESVNGFGRTLVGKGALLGFKCWFDKNRNEVTELAAGHILFRYKYTVPLPAERITFETEITSEYLLNLKGS